MSRLPAEPDPPKVEALIVAPSCRVSCPVSNLNRPALPDPVVSVDNELLSTPAAKVPEPTKFVASLAVMVRLPPCPGPKVEVWIEPPSCTVNNRVLIEILPALPVDWTKLGLNPEILLMVLENCRSARMPVNRIESAKMSRLPAEPDPPKVEALIVAPSCKVSWPVSNLNWPALPDPVVWVDNPLLPTPEAKVPEPIKLVASLAVMVRLPPCPWPEVEVWIELPSCTFSSRVEIVKLPEFPIPSVLLASCEPSIRDRLSAMISILPELPGARTLELEMIAPSANSILIALKLMLPLSPCPGRFSNPGTFLATELKMPLPWLLAPLPVSDILPDASMVTFPTSPSPKPAVAIPLPLMIETSWAVILISPPCPSPTTTFCMKLLSARVTASVTSTLIFPVWLSPTPSPKPIPEEILLKFEIVRLLATTEMSPPPPDVVSMLDALIRATLARLIVSGAISELSDELISTPPPSANATTSTRPPGATNLPPSKLISPPISDRVFSFGTCNVTKLVGKLPRTSILLGWLRPLNQKADGLIDSKLSDSGSKALKTPASPNWILSAVVA